MKRRTEVSTPKSAPQETSQSKTKFSLVGAVWLGAFILFALVVLFGVKYFTTPQTDYTYNSYPFIKETCVGTEDDCYFAELQISGEPYTIQFYYHPSEVDDIMLEYTALEALRTTRTQPNPQVIVGVPDGAPGQIGIAGAQLGRVLGQRYGILNFNVTAQIIGVGADRVDCDDARTNTVVIAFRQGDVDGVFMPSPNCIVLSATDVDRSIAVADAFVYRIFGIIRTMREAEPTNSTS